MCICINCLYVTRGDIHLGLNILGCVQYLGQDHIKNDFLNAI